MKCWLVDNVHVLKDRHVPNNSSNNPTSNVLNTLFYLLIVLWLFYSNIFLSSEIKTENTWTLYWPHSTLQSVDNHWDQLCCSWWLLCTLHYTGCWSNFQTWDYTPGTGLNCLWLWSLFESLLAFLTWIPQGKLEKLGAQADLVWTAMAYTIWPV